MQSLLGIEGMRKEQLVDLLANAMNLNEISQRDIKKVPALRGKTIINLFMEPSTRTRTSFEIAGKWLSADVINISPSTSSVVKGESLRDTALTLQAMCPDAIVLRHKDSGAASFLQNVLSTSAVVNAGDGMHEHPTQALLDLFTLQQHFAPLGRSLEGLTVAIVGDVRHSRVARSNIFAHQLLGNKVRLVGPGTLVPREFADPKCFGDSVSIHTDLEEGIAGADVVMVLRMQLERQQDRFVPSLQEYTNEYCVSESKLRRLCPQCVVLHPGPMNRGLEISSDVVDGPRSLVERQVRSGVIVRMAVLFWAVAGTGTDSKAGELR